MNGESLYKAGDVLTVKGISSDTFYCFQTIVDMVDDFDIELVNKAIAKWGTKSGIVHALENIEIYKYDMVGILPENILQSISKNALFVPSGMGKVHVYPLREVEIIKVIFDINSGETYYYDFNVAGVRVCGVDELSLSRYVK